MSGFKNKKAFSLIELSIVILIIGIIVAGVTQSSRLVRQFKLSSARTLTQSSPVASIKDLGAWFETTSTDSIKDSEADDSAALTTPSYVTTWRDINPTSSIKRNATYVASSGASNYSNYYYNASYYKYNPPSPKSGGYYNATLYIAPPPPANIPAPTYSPSGGITTSPTYYSNCINGLPCLRFNGSNSAYTFDGGFLAGTDYTIFVVEQRRTAAANYFLGDASATAANTAINFGYGSNTTIRFAQGDASNHYTLGVAAYTAPTPRLHTFLNGTIVALAVPNQHYLNGSATASVKTSVGTPALNTLTSFVNARIGAHGSSYFNGDIGEIIIYSRALKNEERVAVEGYLLKKWGIAKAS